MVPRATWTRYTGARGNRVRTAAWTRAATHGYIPLPDQLPGSPRARTQVSSAASTPTRPLQSSTAEKMPERNSPRAPTTSINKDSRGAGSESLASAGEGCGLRSGSAETGRGEEEEKEEEEKEEEREEKGTQRRVGERGRRLPGLGPRASAGHEGGALRGAGEGGGGGGAVPERWASAARPRSRSWRRRRTWFTGAWPARASAVGAGPTGPRGLGGAGGEGGRTSPPGRGTAPAPAPCLRF